MLFSSTWAGHQLLLHSDTDYPPLGKGKDKEKKKKEKESSIAFVCIQSIHSRLLFAIEFWVSLSQNAGFVKCTTVRTKLYGLHKTRIE